MPDRLTIPPEDQNPTETLRKLVEILQKKEQEKQQGPVKTGRQATPVAEPAAPAEQHLETPQTEPEVPPEPETPLEPEVVIPPDEEPFTELPEIPVREPEVVREMYKVFVVCGNPGRQQPEQTSETCTL